MESMRCSVSECTVSTEEETETSLSVKDFSAFLLLPQETKKQKIRIKEKDLIRGYFFLKVYVLIFEI